MRAYNDKRSKLQSSSRPQGVETERKGTETSEGQPSELHADEEYDERASALWAVYVKEAESHDKALIDSWNADMAVVITFAGLFSATVTTFLVASYPNLQPDPPTQTETLAEQNVFLLSLIATHLGANSSTLPLAPPTHLKSFVPTASDVRVNVCWSVSLVLSLTAALFATIVQQWVRDYMHLYQRYSSNLKRARIRQYLFEGADKHKMSFMVDVIPTLIHGSLFLFFWGLCDMLWQINYVVAIMTTFSIALAAVVYAYTVVAPVVNAQSPYQSPLSGIFWYLFRVARRRTYSDKSTGGHERPVSSNMSDGRVQLAMNNSTSRRERDARAICWVVDNLTEDDELEPFLTGIPGSLSTKWGKDVWAEVARTTDHHKKAVATAALSDAQPDSSPFSLSSMDTVIDLSGRITRLLRTCIDPGILEPRSRRQRARACVDAALSLVLNMKKGKWQWFADKEVMARTLHYLADPTHHPSDRGQDIPPLEDPAFRHRWLCMSIMTVHALLQDDRVHESANHAIKSLADVSGESQGLDIDAAALRSSAMLDKLVKKAWHAGRVLRESLNTDDAPEGLLREVLEEHNENVAEIEYCWNILGWAKPVDEAMRLVVQVVSEVTEHILTLLPYASIPTLSTSISSSETYGIHNAMMPHFLMPIAMTSRLVETAWRLRDIQTATWAGYAPKPNRLIDLSPEELYVDDMRRRMSAMAAGCEGSVRPFKEQFWRLQDLAAKHGGTLYVLELFFNALRSTTEKQTPDSEELFVGTFRAVTTHWKKRCDSEAFQAGLVAQLRDVLWRDTVGTTPSLPRLPLYIIDEMLRLVLDVFVAAKEPHASFIDEAVKFVKEFSSNPALPISTRSAVQALLDRIRPPRILRTGTGP